MSNVLVLRTCAADLTSYNGCFQWPESGPVECPDWDPTPECGHGLHGLLWGEGDGTCLDWSADAKWLVVRVLTANLIDLDGKVKFPSGTVVYCGDRVGSTTYIAAHGGAGRQITGHTAIAGDWGTATAGYRGTATAGEGGCIIIRWWNPRNCFQMKAACVGENGLAANTPFKLNDAGEFVPAHPAGETETFEVA